MDFATSCVCMISMILSINSDYFPKQHQPVFIVLGTTAFSMREEPTFRILFTGASGIKQLSALCKTPYLCLEYEPILSTFANL